MTAVGAVGKINAHFAPGRVESYKILVIHRNASAICKLNPKWLEWLRMQDLANSINLHYFLFNCILPLWQAGGLARVEAKKLAASAAALV